MQVGLVQQFALYNGTKIFLGIGCQYGGESLRERGKKVDCLLGGSERRKQEEKQWGLSGQGKKNSVGRGNKIPLQILTDSCLYGYRY